MEQQDRANGWVEAPEPRHASSARGERRRRAARTLPAESGALGDERPDTTRATLHGIILGLLAARPMTGYDIKRAFDRSLASYWNAGNSQIYTALKALAARGLVTADVVEQASRPDRKVYRLTSAGRAELDHWLGEPVPARFTKDQFLARLFFLGEASDELALRHLEDHRSALAAQLAHMAWVLREYGGRPSRRPRLLEFQLLVRDYKQALLQADLDVTEQAIARLRQRLGGPREHATEPT